MKAETGKSKMEIRNLRHYSLREFACDSQGNEKQTARLGERPGGAWHLAPR
jgi:hypothetical protein